MGSTKLGINYLSKYPDQFSNVSIFPVSSPLFVSKFFGSVNEVYSDNKSCKSNFSLEKFWVKRCGWLRLCTTVAMGITITNCWKLFLYGVNRGYRHN